MLVAQSEYPWLDVDAYLFRLDAIAAMVKVRLPTQPSLEDTLLALNRTLFEDLHFTGNREEYYDPRNSFLNDVLDRKRGIPITLSIVYMEVGRRLGLAIQGVGFPGHFLVKLTLPGGDLLLDPFNSGKALSEAELLNRIPEDYRAEPRSSPQQLLATAGKREILARLLRNLKAIYLHRKDFPKALSISTHILAVSPDSASEFRDRGIILEHLECPQAAVSDYQRYLQMAPNAADHADITTRIDTLRTIVSRYN